MASFIHQSPGEVYRTNYITANKFIPSLIFGFFFFYPVHAELKFPDKDMGILHAMQIQTWVREDNAIVCIIFHWTYEKFQAGWQEMQQWTHPQFSVASTEQQKVARKE